MERFLSVNTLLWWLDCGLVGALAAAYGFSSWKDLMVVFLGLLFAGLVLSEMGAL